MASHVEPPIVSLLEMFQTDRLKKDWPAMRALLHPESRLESLAAVDRVLTPDELVGAIQDATTHGVYAVKAWQVELVDPRSGLAFGRIRYRVGRGGFTDEARVWITTERDGLIWRMRIFRDRKAAVACLAREGPDLGL